MKKKILVMVIFGCTTLLFSSCHPKKGCMDISASNFDAEAEKDCGCCEFGKVVFYSRYPAYVVGGVSYSIVTYPIKIFVGTQEIGTVTAFYPNGPGNSNVPGLVSYSPGGNKNVEWYAKVTAPNGSFIVLGSGTFNAGKLTYYVPIF